MNKKRVIVISAAVLMSIIFLLGAISFFKGKTSEEMISKIQIGMSINEVESILSYPKKIIDDNAIVGENAYDDYRSLDKLSRILTTDDLEKRKTRLKAINTASTSNNNLKEYIYNTSKREVQIYFINGSVEYINRSDE